MYTERIAIKEEIHLNREEQWRLRERNQYLMSRLREIDESEREGIDVGGIIDTLANSVKELTRLFPHIPANVMLKHMADLGSENIIINEEKKLNDENYNQVASALEVSEQKERDTDKIIKTIKQNDMKAASVLVATFLKDKGIPIKSSKIFDHLLEKYELYWNKTSQGKAIKTILEYDKHIQKVDGSHGLYQYKF